MQRAQEGQPGYEGERGGAGAGESQAEDHLDHTTQLWERAFWRALEELRVEILKDKIRAAWGPAMGKTAEQVVAAMSEEWKEFHAREARRKEQASEAPQRDRIREVLEKALKKGPQ